MKRNVKDKAAYEKITGAFKRQRRGMTCADVVAKTALPLDMVRELTPLVADEYQGRLQVTESGEILYSFPRGWNSRYRGFRAFLRRAGDKVGRGLKIAGMGFFKGWIMVMLVGYFALFMLIALAALLLSVAASNSNNSSSSRRGSGGGLYLTGSILNFIIRIWFYSELTQSLDRRYNGVQGRPAKPKGRPLYKAIFSFVFGDGDPNADIAVRERKAVIAYLQANAGVISLPEFMALTGAPPAEAEERITAYCAEFGGMPEATEDGTVVYRFDALLLRADVRDRSFAGLSGPIKRLMNFSANTKKMNGWFGVINSVNLFFGGYFFFNALQSGHILTQAHFQATSYLYGVTYVLANQFIANPLPVITIGLGIVPLVFSLFFWLIPALRFASVKKENEKTRQENLRKNAYGLIWDEPLSVRPVRIDPVAEECRPKKMALAQERVVKEMGTYSQPDVEIEGSETVYHFKELETEKAALKKYRQSIAPASSAIGNVVFDSEKTLM